MNLSAHDGNLSASNVVLNAILYTNYTLRMMMHLIWSRGRWMRWGDLDADIK